MLTVALQVGEYQTFCLFSYLIILCNYILTDLICKFGGRILVKYSRNDFTLQKTFSTKFPEKVKTLSSCVEKFSCRVKSQLE